MSATAWKIRQYIGSHPDLCRRVGLIIGIAASGVICCWLMGGKKVPSHLVPQLYGTSINEGDPRAVARPHLAWAATKCLSEIEQPLDQVRAVFADARSQSRVFAEEALGWDSKLTIVSDYFQQKNDHAAFLREKFESLVISEAELLSAVEVGISQFQQTTFSIEGEMLVRLRSDSGDFKSSALAMTSDAAALQSLFQKAITKSGSAAGVELQATVARELASFILGEVATQVGTQLAVSTGVLGVGASSGWTNFGISLVVGIAVDQMITAAYDAYADPKTQLAIQINSQLDLMEKLIIEGADGHPGLRSRLQQFARERAALRESAVLQLLTARQGGAL